MTNDEAKELGAKMAQEFISSMGKNVALVSAVASGFHEAVREFWEVMRNKRIAELDQDKASQLLEFDKIATI